ncbi:hemerythrin domain-containing protein [Roseomonas xinghualingensis]|nr:hemerythrin domain-containing protein [Roseomonas sp. SXEYE001]
MGDSADVIRLCDAWQARLDARIRALLAEHAALRALCDRLEAIADGLPGLPLLEERHAVAEQLTALLLGHQRCESELLDNLLPSDEGSAMRRVLIERIRSQHVEDMVHAQDLGAALVDGRSEAQALGYMLRCFFDGCRRALAFEELAILKLARQRLSPVTRELLVASLGARRQPG